MVNNMVVNAGEKLLYKIREMAMFQKGKMYIVRREGVPDEEYTNPIVAWGQWVESVDVLGRKRIGDYLEQNGRNRYSGEPVQIHHPKTLEAGGKNIIGIGEAEHEEKHGRSHSNDYKNIAKTSNDR